MNAPLPGGGTGFGLEKIGTNPTSADEIIISTPVRVSTKQTPPPFALVDPSTGNEILVDTTKFDAIFWGEVSAEKFLIPYYARFMDDAGMQALREAIADPNVVAIGHEYPTFVDVVAQIPELSILDPNQVERASGSAFIPLSEWATGDRRPPSPPS
ncbi:hypothetical protein [Gemmatimonas sp.]|uniref:hypothetical protein n=1 Tax=Gemmatimonas sp. TaxID=1962908 RepID=UPI003983A7B6